MKQESQSGFVHLIIVIVVLGAVLVGALGLVSYRNFMQKNNSDTPTSQQKVSENKTKPAASATDETSSWTILDTDYFTMPIPDGWKLQKLVISETNRDNGLVIVPYEYALNASLALTYNSGTRASIAITKESRDSGHGFVSSFIIGYQAAVDKDIVDVPLFDEVLGYAKLPDIKTNKGLLIHKYHMYWDKRPADAFESPIVDGTNEYQYQFKIYKYPVGVSYYIAPGQPDNTVQLEKALKAIVIK